MVCPICPAAGWCGAWIGGYMGINTSEKPGAKIVSALITANLMAVTILFLKSYYNVSICGGGSIPERILRAGLISLVLGIIYSIGVNVLLNRFVFNDTAPNGNHAGGSCCNQP